MTSYLIRQISTPKIRLKLVVTLAAGVLTILAFLNTSLTPPWSPVSSVATLPGRGTGDRPTGPPREWERWSRRIDAFGAGRAYGEFKREYRSTPIRSRHIRSHIFGALLYEKLGMDGITLCDHDFAYAGCEHGFVIRAATQRGLAIVRDLNGACQQRFQLAFQVLSCQHGIGHGIIEYMGHEKLVEALHLCTTAVPQENPLAGCTIGVLMGYNIGIPIAEATPLDARAFDSQNPYTPCPSLPVEFQTACYQELPHWWEIVLAEDYGRIGNLCNAIGNAEAQLACFRGVGKYAGLTSGYDVDATIRKCQAMPTHEGEVLCRETSSLRFLLIPEYRELAPALCEGLTPNELHRCVLEINTELRVLQLPYPIN